MFDTQLVGHANPKKPKKFRIKKKDKSKTDI